jgi:hypothetical protein
MLRYNGIELKSLFSRKSNAREFVGSYRIDSEDIVAIWDTPGSPALKAQLLANDVQAIARRTTDRTAGVLDQPAGLPYIPPKCRPLMAAATHRKPRAHGERYN